MSAGAPWSVKGIDAKAREVAKDLARRSGLTLGEWLNQMILEGEDVGAAIRRERERMAAPTRAPEYSDSDYDDDYVASQPVVRRRPPVYREVQNDIAPQPVRRAPAFSSGAQPLSSRDLRRRSIFEDRPSEGRVREERYRDERPRYEEAASPELGRVASALESLSARIEGSETRSASAVRGVSSAVETLLGRLERSEAALERTEAAHDETRGRLEEAAHSLQSSFDRHEESREVLAARLEQAERLIDAQAERLEGLSGHVREERDRVGRVEAELRSPAANEGVRLVEGALGKLANQLYEGEQRTRDTLKDVREDMVGLSHRLTQIELRDPDRAAQGLIDKVVTQMAQRLEQAEAQTSGAIKALEQAFSTLDARLSRAEERGDVTDPESVQSLQGLATELSRRVENSRAELLNAMQDRSQVSAEELLSTLSRRIEETEHRSAAAIEKLGEDVMRIADNLNRRAGEVEKEVRQIGTDLDAKIDSRFEQGESSHAQALERLGAEIARISERLSSKIGESERRAAQAIEGVGQFVEQSRDEARSELAARIRQSEERTARQLEETRKTIDNKLARVAAHSLLSETAARGGAAQARLRSDLPNPFETPHYAEPEAETSLAKPMAQRVTFAPIQGGYEDNEADYDQDDYGGEADVSGQTDTAESYLPEQEAAPEIDEAEAESDLVAAEAPAEIEAAAEDDHLDLTETVTAETADDFNPFAAEDLEADLEPESAKPEMVNSPLGPRALRGSVASVQSAVAALTEREDDSDPFADVEVSRKTAPLRTAAPRNPVSFTPMNASRDVEDDDLDAFTPSRPMTPTVEEDGGISVSTRDALAAARAAVRASMETTADNRNQSFNLQAGIPRARMAEARAAKVKKDSGMLLNAFKASAVAVVVVSAGLGGYLALKDKAPDQIAATAVTTGPDLSLLNSEYNSADKALKAGDPKAVALLQKVADQGLPKAQFRLGALYSGESHLIPEDPSQARNWTEKAAGNGVTKAMYNLGLYYYNGYGGEKNHVLAANWFRKSAENGLFEGQYNLGLMYQQGDGVPLDPSEAYKWLKLAAKSKPADRDAVANAAEVRSQLSEDQALRADEAVNAFVPAHVDADTDATPSS